MLLEIEIWFARVLVLNHTSIIKMAFDTDILAFGAHPDDIEISASGTILKSISEGKKVSIVDLPVGELGTRGSVQTRALESTEASKLLGINKRVNLKLNDGFINSSEASVQSVIEQLEDLNLKLYWLMR